MAIETDKYLNGSDIAEILGISRTTAFRWLTEGKIQHQRIGDTRRVKPADLLRYLEDLGNSPAAMRDFERDIKKYINITDVAEQGNADVFVRGIYRLTDSVEYEGAPAETKVELLESYLERYRDKLPV